ncbi:FecR domain-containing protein [Alloalcanivorax sp. C16-2]|uniref:FecR domain-containing protein n=1 Tax=Alloalcanivorax sp. C16-2 TaxID=3390052 RepID=UPI003970919F
MSADAALGRHAARHGLELPRLEAALEWQVTLWSGEMDDAGHRDWAAWLAAHPGNQRAWAEVERLAGRLGELPSDVARHTLKRPRRFSRRQALSLFGLAGAGALVARGGWVERAVADCRSGPGEQRDLTLPDGSSLKLNTASAVNLAFDGERRLRVLPGSEIALDSRGAGGAPLRVEMAEMRLDASDSHVVLRDHGERLAVSVLAGRVEVLSGPGGIASQAATLLGGEAAWLSAGGVRRVPLDRAAALDWTRGVMRADRLPLNAFLAELGRYRHGLLYCDDDVAGLVVSGAFPVRDTDYALQSLAQALPVAVHYRTPWLVRVSAV